MFQRDATLGVVSRLDQLDDRVLKIKEIAAGYQRAQFDAIRFHDNLGDEDDDDDDDNDNDPNGDENLNDDNEKNNS